MTFDELEDWAVAFGRVADGALSDVEMLVEAPADQIPYGVLHVAMATMQHVSRLLRCACAELDMPGDAELDAMVARCFASSSRPAGGRTNPAVRGGGGRG